VHTSITPKIEQEGESSPTRIHLPYQDVHKFQHDGSNAPQDAMKDVARTGIQEATEVL
jgi:hypothetical protein